MLEPSTPVQYVKGIGPRLAEILAAKGIHTVDDLLHYLPFRYEDRLNPRTIAELRSGEMATVIAEVRTAGLFRTRSRMQIYEMTAGQGRATLKCLWFHGAYLKDKFKPGQVVALYGKVEEPGREGRGLQIVQPQFEILSDPDDEGDAKDPAQSLEIGRIVPIYETASHGKLTSRWFRRVIRGALESLPAQSIGPDPIPTTIRERLQLMEKPKAFWETHWPESGASLDELQAQRTPAHLRLIFEELFFLELGLELKRRRLRAQPGISFALTDQVRESIKKILPF